MLTTKKLDKKLLSIPTLDNGQDMVDIGILIKNNNLSCVFSKDKLFKPFLKIDVANNLIKAIKQFNKLGFIPKIESAYRSPFQQQQIFLNRISEIKNKYPNKNEDEIVLLANKYSAGIPVLASHIMGAGIDILLLDKNKKLLDFGSKYKDSSIKSKLFFKGITKNQWKNRKILKTVMENNDFVNYPFEYWHYSYGDVCYAYYKNLPHAFYQPLEYNPINNTKSYYPIEQCYQFFKKL